MIGPVPWSITDIHITIIWLGRGCGELRGEGGGGGVSTVVYCTFLCSCIFLFFAYHIIDKQVYDSFSFVHLFVAYHRLTKRAVFRLNCVQRNTLYLYTLLCVFICAFICSCVAYHAFAIMDPRYFSPLHDSESKTDHKIMKYQYRRLSNSMVLGHWFLILLLYKLFFLLLSYICFLLWLWYYGIMAPV